MSALLKRLFLFALGELPQFVREKDSGRLLLMVGIVGSLAMLLGNFHEIRSKGILLDDLWRGAVYGALPFAAAVLWSLRGEKGTFRMATLGTAAVVAPIGFRVLSDAAADALRANAWLLAGPVVLGLVVLVFAAWRAKISLANWGISLGDMRWWVPRAALAVAILVPALWVVLSLNPSLAEFYPTLRAARSEPGAFAVHHFGIALDFLGWEFLFRGFLLFGIARRGDSATAVWLQAIPFFLLHSGKPYVELLTSLGGGLAAGWFCLRARTFLPLFLLHWIQMTSVGLFANLLRG